MALTCMRSISVLRAFSRVSHSVALSTSASQQAEFNWKDALNLESKLTEDEIIMRDQVRQYCQNKLMPRVIEANRKERDSMIFAIVVESEKLIASIYGVEK